MLPGVMTPDFALGKGCPDGRCAPPRRFRSAEGVVEARREPSGPFATPSLRGKSEAQKLGIRYERKVLKELSVEYGARFAPSQWFSYRVSGDTSRRWCQVDGFLASSPNEDSLTLFEVKSRFTSDAWYQLRQLYAPVVGCVYPTASLRLVVICRSFDPWTPFPEAYSVLESLEKIPSNVMGVFPWRL